MNILFFLTPKSEVVYISASHSVRKALMTIQANTYTALPLIGEDGTYQGTLTEGDFLRYFTEQNAGEHEARLNEVVTELPRAFHYDPVSINSNMEDLLMKASNQNFIPVVDDESKFIGIITRKDLMQYMYNLCKKNHILKD